MDYRKYATDLLRMRPLTDEQIAEAIRQWKAAQMPVSRYWQVMVLSRADDIGMWHWQRLCAQ